MTRISPLATVATLGLVFGGCSWESAPESRGTAVVERWAPQRLETEHLPNAYLLHPRVISGGQPAGRAGFRELRELGVRTVISVDGAPPQLDQAREFGLRYVHLPHGYDAVPEARGRLLAKAVRELPGAIYIHCHHGKHRSPAAAAIACVGAGLLPSQYALSVLWTAGTSEHYQGLYESAKRARQIDLAVLDALPADFPEAVQVPPMAEAMVAIERAHDRLDAIRKAGWRPPPGHPELDPPHEALLLREHFTELLRTTEVLDQPPPFQQWLRDSETAAEVLEAGLRGWSDRQAPVPAAVPGAFARVTDNCQACHRRFRDVPRLATGRPAWPLSSIVPPIAPSTALPLPIAPRG